MSRIVLITGGAGFIGYHLARFHAGRGDRVILLDNLFKTDGRMDEELHALLQAPGVDYRAVDLTQGPPPLGDLPPLDLVYHLAAINGTQLFYDIPYQLARAQLLMTIHLLQALEGRKVGALVYASTSEVYAGCEAVGLLRIPTDEGIPVVFPQPTAVRFSYGTSKFMGEFLCAQFGRQFNVPTSIVRYHNIYGPRMGTRHVIPEFIARIRSGERPFAVYGGGETRAFCYVDDAVRATHAVATTPACRGEIVHIGNAREEISIGELARRLIRQAGESIEIAERGRRDGSVSRRCPDTSKLKRLTGYEAQVDLQDGLARTLEWYTAHATV